MSKHQKHAKLVKPAFGEFHRNEVAILGTPCGNIKKLAFAITEALHSTYKLSYVDADHKSADEEDVQGKDVNSALAYGANMEFTDKITFSRFDHKPAFTSYQYRQHFNEQDLVLVNGNHFKAKKQLVVLDPKKFASLERKLDRLTDVGMLVKVQPEVEIPEFLKSHLENCDELPVYEWDDTEGIVNWIKQTVIVPKLYGLVLAGGKSVRMQQDKGLIDYHGKPQREYVFEQMREVCEEVFISCRDDQSTALEAFPLITDKFLGLGPYGAILSAFQQNPDAAWLVAACDMPNLSAKHLKHLVEHRNSSQLATAYLNAETDFPDPLLTIWEPKSYMALFNFLAQGYSCPRKVLINSEIELIQPLDQSVLKNVNTPEELEEIREDNKK
ncbi:NTP transferase domain-containing protein [Rapidithrix thailandica]|uniref:Probable molybdenum cofactor guanylyltransferase n=1 Tax=Rapidithrix thailandica TaxID=413964 RepID=A0AAW9RQ59_9BACT